MINSNFKTGTNNYFFVSLFFLLSPLRKRNKLWINFFFFRYRFSWFSLKTSCSNVKCHETDFFFPPSVSWPSALVRTMQTYEFHSWDVGHGRTQPCLPVQPNALWDWLPAPFHSRMCESEKLSLKLFSWLCERG